MFLVLGIVMLILIAIFIILYFFAPHSEMMHAFKTTKSFVISQIVLLAVAGYFIGAHYNGLHEADWRTSWTHPITIGSESVTYAGSESKVGLVLNEKPKANSPFNSELITWNPYEEMKIEVTRKWGGVDPIEKELSTPTNENVPYTYPVSLKFPKEGTWKITVYADGDKLSDIVIEVK